MARSAEMRERRPDRDDGILPMRRGISVCRRRVARGIMCRHQARARVQAPRRREGRRYKYAAAAEHLSLECGTEIKSDEAEVIPSLYLRRVSAVYVMGGPYRDKGEAKYMRRRGHGFRGNLGFAGRHAPPRRVAAALMQYAAGASMGRIRAMLEGQGMRVRQDTAQNWLVRCATQAERHTRHVKPPTIGKWTPGLLGASAKSRYCPSVFSG